jgi:hypothetical protein
MNDLVPVRRVPKVIEGEVLPASGPVFTHREFGITFRTWHPSSAMRALGYTNNPDICSHSRKGFTPRDGWWCKDCGDGL